MNYTFKRFLYMVILMSGSILCSQNIQWSGDHYDKNSSPQFNAGSRVIAHFTTDFPLLGNEKILDVGCATGNLVVTLAQQVPEGLVIGIDISSDMIECAKKKYQEVENVQFQTCPAQELEKIGHNEFDLITCLACLHFIPLDEQPKVFSNINSCLKQGGTLLLTTVSKSKPFAFREAALATVTQPEWSQYLTNVPNLLFIRTKEDMEQIVHQAGFDATVQETEHVYAFTTRHDFFNWLYGWLVGFSIFTEIPETKRKEFLNATIETYLDQMNWHPGDDIIYVVPILKIIAHKN